MSKSLLGSHPKPSVAEGLTQLLGVQDAAAASAEVQKQQQSKQQAALDTVSELKSDLWQLWQQVS